MKIQIYFLVLVSCMYQQHVISKSVRVRINGNPYIYEIANPAPQQRSEVLDSAASENRGARSLPLTHHSNQPVPIHPVRGFSAESTAAANNRRTVAPAPPARSAELRAPISAPTGNRLNRPEALEAEEPEVIQPYKIQYDSVDANGTLMTRQESKDDKGVVTGSYSYTDPLGIFRVVEYIADQNGFRASIRTNEPGIGKSDNGDPASTIYEIDPAPSRAARS